MSDALEELIRLWYFDRVLAHRTLFAHRHPEASPPFHDVMVRAWHSPSLRDLFEVFRGGAKSTIAEEALVLRVCFREFRNLLLVGATEERADERIQAVRHELETNEWILDVFGDLRGPTWTDGELVTSTGIRLLGIGKGQELRGTKHNDMRPDACLLDDFETKDDVKDDRSRKKLRRWFMKELVPALAPRAWVRINQTPLNADALIVHFEKSGEWEVHKYPAKFLNDVGEWESAWPERFTLQYLNGVERNMRALGLGEEFQAEYMVNPEHEEDKVFRHEMYRTEPVARTWQSVYCFFDPARTSKPTSAQTGAVAASFVRDQIVVWEAWGKHLKPNEIINEIFDMNAAYRPVEIGVETDGVDDFLTQPIRERAKEEGFIPVKPYRAPAGKIDFIKGLQPWFHGRDVIFAKDFPELRAQLNSIPTGLLDIANALAYIPRMRPGAPIYDNFGSRHVADELAAFRLEPAYLVLHATRGLVAGVLLQYRRGVVRVIDDFLREGEPAAVLTDIYNAATLRVGKRPELVAPPIHWNQHLNVGLVQAARRIPAEVQQGLNPEMGRVALAQLMAGHGRDDEPLFMAAESARWTLNALAGGYCRTITKGVISAHAAEGPYKVLMEGLESFVGLISVMGSPNGEADDRNYEFTNDGRRFVSARPRR